MNSMNVYISLKCADCQTDTVFHETGMNEYDIYPCPKCFPDKAIINDDE